MQHLAGRTASKASHERDDNVYHSRTVQVRVLHVPAHFPRLRRTDEILLKHGMQEGDMHDIGEVGAPRGARWHRGSRVRRATRSLSTARRVVVLEVAAAWASGTGCRKSRGWPPRAPCMTWVAPIQQ